MNTKKTALIVLALITIGILVLFTWRVISIPWVPPKTPEMILDDTLQMNQGRIPDAYEEIERSDGHVDIRPKRRIDSL